MSAWLTWLGLWACRLLAFSPGPLRYLLARMAGAVAFGLGGSRRQVALKNLQLCFPQWTQAQRNAIARRHFELFVVAFIDCFRVWFGSSDTLKRLVRVSGAEHLTAASAGPVILLAPHFLGLEAGGLRLQMDHRLVCMYSNQSNPIVNEWVLRGRNRFNAPLILSRQEGIAALVRWMRRGVTAHFSPDLDFGPRDAIFAPFFGNPAATVTSVVRLSRALGATVVPLVTRMIRPGEYEARFYPGWQHPNNDQVQTLAQGVEQMNQFIEARVLEAPEQYLWTHRRFKSRPQGEPPVYG